MEKPLDKINNLVSNKATIKTLEFVLGMAKESYERQKRKTGSFLTIDVICQHYQQLNINDAQKIIDAIKEYQEENK